MRGGRGREGVGILQKCIFGVPKKLHISYTNVKRLFYSQLEVPAVRFDRNAKQKPQGANMARKVRQNARPF